MMKDVRGAFTLFELILAIALSATLLALVGAAINLYLLRVDAGRTRVEEAQLARTVLAMIAADVRATTIYQPQDTSSLAELVENNASFDVDRIDESGTFSGSAIGTTSTSAPTGTSSTAGTSSSTSSDGTSYGAEITTTVSPGVNGTLQELQLDILRLPRLSELFPAMPQQPAAMPAAAAELPRPSDIKSVRYFVRQGEPINASDLAATSLAPEAQLRAGGLVRHTIDRAVRTMAEQSANQALLYSGQVLVAPEVVHIEFRYFDGTTAVDTWDMQERGALPPAIEARIWFTDTSGGQAATYAGTAEALASARMYSQTIELPHYETSAADDSSSAGTDSEVEDAESGGNSGSETGGFGTGGGAEGQGR